MRERKEIQITRRERSVREMPKYPLNIIIFELGMILGILLSIGNKI